jgi:phospholipid/cholesterol/gamma-HCH transport system ATP-binding protein
MSDPEQSTHCQIELVGVGVVSLRDGNSVRIQNVNWQVQPGQYWVVGSAHGLASGDVMLTAAGLLRPEGGTVRLFGRDVAALRDAEMIALRRRVGVVFRGGGRMFSRMTVRDNIALPLRYAFDWTPEQADEAVNPIMDALGLAAFANATAVSLGLRWQLRTGLARALALKPEVLFLEEPLAGLDAQDRRWWLEFLDALSKGTSPLRLAPVTLAVVTNDLTAWVSRGSHFALIEEQRWAVAAGRGELEHLLKTKA